MKTTLFWIFGIFMAIVLMRAMQAPQPNAASTVAVSTAAAAVVAPTAEPTATDTPTDAPPTDDRLVRAKSPDDAPYLQPDIYIGQTYRVREGYVTESRARAAMLAEDIGNDDGVKLVRSSGGYYMFGVALSDPNDDYPRCYVLDQPMRHGIADHDPVQCKLVSGTSSGDIIWATWITVRHD